MAENEEELKEVVDPDAEGRPAACDAGEDEADFAAEDVGGD